MRTKHAFTVVLVALLFCFQSFSQDQAEIKEVMNKDIMHKKESMKTYLIEREIPDAGKLTREELKGISKKSNEVLAEMGSVIEWVHSYVTDNKVYCVYKAESPEAIKEHAKKGGFPANRISELSATIDPATAQD